MLEVFEPDFGRFLQVLRREGEPDRVPFVEFWIDYRAGEPLAGPPPQDPEASPAYRIKWMQALGAMSIAGLSRVGRTSSSTRGRRSRTPASPTSRSWKGCCRRA